MVDIFDLPTLFDWLNTVDPAEGYLALFVVSAIGNATILLPIPVFLLIYAAGSASSDVFSCFVIGVVAGAGAAVGELVGYAIGYGVEIEAHIDMKFGRQYDFTRKLFSKYGFLVIPVFAATPLPHDIVGIICGVIRYPVEKFFIGTLIGKIIVSTVLALGGFYSFTIVKTVFGEEGAIAGVILLAAVLLVLYYVHRKHVRWDTLLEGV
jgi:membrane protein DedA with SNARE-associated domain